MLKISGILLLICINMIAVYGQDSSYVADFSATLKKIKLLTPEEYVQKILPLKKHINDLFEKKQGVCRGEFSNDIFLSGSKLSLSDKKQSMSVAQRTECLVELDSNMLAYQKVIYQKRKSFFIYSHQIQLKKLEQDFIQIKDEITIRLNKLKKKLKRYRR